MNLLQRFSVWLSDWRQGSGTNTSDVGKIVELIKPDAVGQVAAWVGPIRRFAAKYGNSTGYVVNQILAVAFPGVGSVIGAAAEKACRCAQKASEELEQELRRQASEQELERIGQLMEVFLNQLGGLCDQIVKMEGSPEQPAELIRQQLATQDAVQEGFRQIASIAERLEVVEHKLDAVLSRLDYGNDLAAELLPWIRQNDTVIRFVEEWQQAGLTPAIVVAKIKQLDDLLRKLYDYPAEVVPLIAVMENKFPQSPNVQMLAAASAILTNDLHKAEGFCKRATELQTGPRRSEWESRLTNTTEGIRDHLDLPAAPAKSGEVLDGYRLVRLLGRGGQGMVFKAERDGQSVAVKVLLPKLAQDRKVLEQFKAEIVSLVALGTQPHVVRFASHGYCESKRCWYLAMELIAGESLHTRLRRGPLTIAEGVRIIQQVAGPGGLQTVHERGLLHRDIKPANILIDANRTPKLVDFGLAGAVRGGTQIKGYTATFAPPEQFKSRTSLRSDVYSLAATLWYALTRKDPEEARTLECEPDHQSLLDLIREAMSYDPESRPRHAGEFAEKLSSLSVGHKSQYLIVHEPKLASELPPTQSLNLTPIDPAPKVVASLTPTTSISESSKEIAPVARARVAAPAEQIRAAAQARDAAWAEEEEEEEKMPKHRAEELYRQAMATVDSNASERRKRQFEKAQKRLLALRRSKPLDELNDYELGGFGPDGFDDDLDNGTGTSPSTPPRRR